MNVQPRTQPGIWLHDLPLLATIGRAIVATNAHTSPASMTMAIAYESAPREFSTVTTTVMGTSQEGEALTMLFNIGQLAAQQGSYSVVPDSE